MDSYLVSLDFTSKIEDIIIKDKLHPYLYEDYKELFEYLFSRDRIPHDADLDECLVEIIDSTDYYFSLSDYNEDNHTDYDRIEELIGNCGRDVFITTRDAIILY
jgi:hypothetical protein